MEKYKEMKWEKINIKSDNEEVYTFEIGCNILPSWESNTLICFNKSDLSHKQGNKIDYFRIDKINLEDGLANNSFETILDKMDGPRFRITNIVFSYKNRNYYFYGGLMALNREINLYFQDLWEYDPLENDFTQLLYKVKNQEDSPGPRGAHSLICDSEKNKLYLFAGKNEKQRFNDLYEYDIVLNRFAKIESLTNPPLPRNNHTACIYKRSMIIYGGWDGTKTLNDMYELSLNTHIWYNISYKSELVPPPTYRHTNTIIGDYILIFGGVNEHNEKFNELYLMNFTEKKWNILLAAGQYPSPRTFHNMSSIDNRIFIFGGYSGSILHDGYSLLLNKNFSQSDYELDVNISEEKPINSSEEYTDSENNTDYIKLLKNQIYEIKLKYENEISKNNCKICFEREINTVILDCYHRYICYECSLKCTDSKCPACKREIKQIIKTYN